MMFPKQFKIDDIRAGWYPETAEIVVSRLDVEAFEKALLAFVSTYIAEIAKKKIAGREDE